MKKITKLKRNQVFVFGSNALGIHGAGAALTARKLFGAQHGVGGGRTGQSYAIPTKATPRIRLNTEAIRAHVDLFLAYATRFPDLEFLLTPIGCGAACYTPEQIAPMFRGAPFNVVLPPEFEAVLMKLAEDGMKKMGWDKDR